MSLLELVFIPTLLPIPTLPPIYTLGQEPTLLLIHTLQPEPTLPPIPPFLRQALTTAIPLPVLAVDWERIKKFRSIL